MSLRSSDIPMIAKLLVLILILAVSSIISASEAGYLGLRPEDIRKLTLPAGRRSSVFIKLFNNTERLLNTFLVSNTILNTVFILLASVICLQLFNPAEGRVAGFIIGVAVFLIVLLMFGQVLPRALVSKESGKLVFMMAYPVLFLLWVLYPVTSLIGFLSSAARRQKQIAEQEISESSKNGQADTGNDDEKILKGIENFGNTNVNAIMCPRIDVTAIDIKWGFDRIIPVIIESGFSRIPVYSGSFDTVRGILYAKDVLPYASNPANFKWQSLLRPSYFVPETKKINDLLKEFQLRKIHMAVVIDEYGGASGIVTLEDILEEIVGDITDESDEDENLYRKIDESNYLFEGKILLHDFCRILDVDEHIFNDIRGESETLAGVLIELAGEIPVKDQVIRFENFVFRIEAVDRRRIREVHLEIKKEE